MGGYLCCFIGSLVPRKYVWCLRGMALHLLIWKQAGASKDALRDLIKIMLSCAAKVPVLRNNIWDLM